MTLTTDLITLDLMSQDDHAELRSFTSGPPPPPSGDAFLQSCGIPTVTPLRALPEVHVGPMSEAEQRTWQLECGIPTAEATYSTQQNGEPVEVNYTADPGEIKARAAALVAVIEATYRGTPNLEQSQAQDLLIAAEHTGGLSPAQWTLLESLEAKYARQLQAHADGDDGQDPLDVGEPTRLTSESDGGARFLREANIPTTVGPTRPTHEIMAELDGKVPSDHSDRQYVNRIKPKGAATSRADGNVAAVLAKRWGVRTEAKEPPPDDGQEWMDMGDADGHPLGESDDGSALLYAVAPDATWIRAKRPVPVNGEGPSYDELLSQHDWYKGAA
jgi:hypothetical protein